MLISLYSFGNQSLANIPQLHTEAHPWELNLARVRLVVATLENLSLFSNHFSCNMLFPDQVVSQFQRPVSAFHTELLNPHDDG